MINGINHITLAVKDINVAFKFYQEVLGLKPICKWDKGAYFLAGDFWLCLNVDARREPNLCYTHYAFNVAVKDFEKMSQAIVQSGAYIFKENTSPGESLYFLNPDGHKLEIHIGNWQTRMQIKKMDAGNWTNVEWFL